MNQLAVVEGRPKSVLLDMSDRYGMEPAAFEATVRATCMRPDKNGRIPSREEFAAFLLVAKEYGLNPLTKEIYAYSAKGGGIVPIVSVDGWVNMVNSHKACDGFEFEMEHDEDKKLISCTCKMFRKDRSHPVSVTEYLSECYRETEPWKMKHRMLRHKSMIQAARYAFGFSGIYDEDEGRTIAEAQDITPARAPVPSPSEVEQIEDHGTDKYKPGDIIETTAQEVVVKAGPMETAKPAAGPNIKTEYEEWLTFVGKNIAAATDGGELESFFNEHVEGNRSDVFPPDYTDLAEACGKKQTELGADQ